jgi:hypothetical protein
VGTRAWVAVGGWRGRNEWDEMQQHHFSGHERTLKCVCVCVCGNPPAYGFTIIWRLDSCHKHV